MRQLFLTLVQNIPVSHSTHFITEGHRRSQKVTEGHRLTVVIKNRDVCILTVSPLHSHNEFE